MKKNNAKSIMVAQPILLGHSYDTSLIKNVYVVKANYRECIKIMLTSYPYIRFSVSHEAQVIITETRKEPSIFATVDSIELNTVNQLGSYVYISSKTSPHENYGWESVIDSVGTSISIDGEFIYKQKVISNNQLIQFIPPNAHIWGVLDLCTVDKLEPTK